MSDADLLNDALAQEHAAVYGFPVIAARFESLSDRVERTLTAHEDRIEALTDLIETLEAIPVTAQPAYPVPALERLAEAEGFAEELERACLAAYVRVLREGEAGHREFATDAAIETAEWLVRWGAAAEAFPGLTLR